MKLSSTSLLFAVALLSVNNNNIVANGNECGELDTLCSGEYTAPDAPSVCKDGIKPTESCKVACTINGIAYVCNNGVFEQGTVGAAFSDPPAGPPTGCDGTAADCSGTAVIMKDSEETDVSGIDIGIDDSAASATIVSSIVGITAAVGVVALL